MADNEAEGAYAAATQQDDGDNAGYYAEGDYANGQAYGETQGYDGTAGYAAYGEGDYYAGYDATTAAGAYDETTGEWLEDPTAYAAGGGEYDYRYAADGAEMEGSYFALDGVDPNAPTSPFGDATYWEQYGEPSAPASYEAAEERREDEHGLLEEQEAANGEAGDAVEAEPADPDAGTTATTITRGSNTPATATDSALELPTSTLPPSSPGRQRKKKTKTKQERMQKRQEQLEKGEAKKEAKETASGGADATTADTAAATTDKLAKQVAKRSEMRLPTFLERERAKVRLRMRKARAIARKRMPVQVRILPETRTHLSPMEIYFGGSVEAALSDIFWAAVKGDLRRVQFLVEVERVSASDSAFDPWHMEQTPLHWAAKGGSAAVIEYLLGQKANPRSLDETGSMPLHLACWAGHADAALALLRATDTKDLYVQDYDAALAPLDWAHVRGHAQLVQAIERYEDSLWLPKFVDDLIRGIVRYKIKLYKEPPKSPKSPTRGIHFRRPGGAANDPSAAAAKPTDNQAADAAAGAASATPANDKTASGTTDKDAAPTETAPHVATNASTK